MCRADRIDNFGPEEYVLLCILTYACFFIVLRYYNRGVLLLLLPFFGTKRDK